MRCRWIGSTIWIPGSRWCRRLAGLVPAIPAVTGCRVPRMSPRAVDRPGPRQRRRRRRYRPRLGPGRLARPVEAVGGTMTLDSPARAGTVLTVRLPVTTEDHLSERTVMQRRNEPGRWPAGKAAPPIAQPAVYRNGRWVVKAGEPGVRWRGARRPGRLQPICRPAPRVWGRARHENYVFPVAAEAHASRSGGQASEPNAGRTRN